MRRLRELIAISRLHNLVEIKAVRELARAINLHHFAGRAHPKSINVDLEDGREFSNSKELFGSLLTLLLVLVGIVAREFLSGEQALQRLLNCHRLLQVKLQHGEGLFFDALVVNIGALEY